MSDELQSASQGCHRTAASFLLQIPRGMDDKYKYRYMHKYKIQIQIPLEMDDNTNTNTCTVYIVHVPRHIVVHI